MLKLKQEVILVERQIYIFSLTDPTESSVSRSEVLRHSFQSISVGASQLGCWLVYDEYFMALFPSNKFSQSGIEKINTVYWKLLPLGSFIFYFHSVLFYREKTQLYGHYGNQDICQRLLALYGRHHWGTQTVLHTNLLTGESVPSSGF